MTNEVPYSDIRQSVAFTGYRPYKLPFGCDFNHPDAIRLRAILKAEYERLYKQGFRQFLTGGALGCDMMAAEVILEMKQEYGGRKSGIIHVLCIPCRRHTAKWEEADRERIRKIADKSLVHFVSDKPYFNGCMQARNRYMVDTSRVLIAVYDGKKGGTHNTVEYAQKMNKKIIVIRPNDFMRLDLISSPSDIALASFNDDWDYNI